MEESETVRKVRYRQGSFVVTIPKGMAEQLGLGRDQYVRIALSGGRIIVSPMSLDMGDEVYDTGSAAGHGTELNRTSWSNKDGMSHDASATPDQDYGEPDGGYDEGQDRLDGLRM